ncbi:extracellular solute-binding protein [Paenibacillus doosanensis]|uniref:ABC transporter substrate-binding protein n=1 Tax=Paenibacillus doosanensis TaxID=1229154 RepID=UPI0021805B57|nr:extracellular solute-binding protein [Paenibacillus doosanensis]MCS7461455.1 extracellular solute-binding protein [Paenibacillus doosanensis]
MRQRRKLMGVMTGLLALSIITTACSGGGVENKETANKPAGKTTLSWMVWSTADIPKQLSEQVFNAFPEMKEKLEVQPLLAGPGDGDVIQKFRLMLASNEEMPDIVMLSYSQLAEFADDGVLEDLTKVITPYIDKMTKGAVELASYKGKFIDFPYQIKPKVWIYRKDLFEGAGIDPSQVKTTDDFIAAGKKLHEKYPNSYIWNIGRPVQGNLLDMILSGNGGRFTDDKGNYILDTDPGVRKAFETIKRIKESGVVANVQEGTPDYEKSFANSTFASYLTGSWIKNSMEKYAPDQAGKWGVAEWPNIADSIGGSDTGGSVWVVPAKAKHKEEAIEFLTKLVLTKEGGIGAYKARGIFPSMREAGVEAQKIPHPFLGADLPNTEAKSVENVKVSQFTKAASLEFKIVNAYLDKYVYGEMNLDAALKQAKADLLNQVGNPNKK